jgi:sugar (pentulose or hexulose) kinase
MKLLLGIDYGTGGSTVTVIDETGSFIGEASTEFESSLDHRG